MDLWSIAFSYRLGLGFHALNNEGADGSNLMQPRRIDVGNVTYDGISGEMVRHHILRNLVALCGSRGLPMLPMSEGLHPDRGPLGIRHSARSIGHEKLEATSLYPSVRKAIESCVILDIGGYLAAWREQPTAYIAEKAYVEKSCASVTALEPVKRDSCFDVAWMISEAPQNLTITQHSAYRDTFGLNSRYAQTMRTNTYGGVIRADLHRIGTDDHWYLQDPRPERQVLTPEQRLARQTSLIQAIGDYLASPTGAKVAGWAPHCFLIEGAVLLSRARTAPFESPIRVDLSATGSPVQPNVGYRERMCGVADGSDTWAWTFDSTQDLLRVIGEVTKHLSTAPTEEAGG